MAKKGASKQKSKSVKSEIVRHAEKSESAEGFPPAQLTSGQMEKLEAHVRKHVGDFKNVLHEILSFGIHLDVLPIEPARRRKFNVYVTVGMSAVPMDVPRGHPGPKRAEMMVVLPPDGRTDEKGLKKHKYGWAIECVRELARIPSVARRIGSLRNGNTAVWERGAEGVG